jgi:hypothetical protein
VFSYDGAGNQVGSWQAAEVTAATGIATDGTDLWISDASEETVFRYAGGVTLTTGLVDLSLSGAWSNDDDELLGVLADDVFGQRF